MSKNASGAGGAAEAVAVWVCFAFFCCGVDGVRGAGADAEDVAGACADACVSPSPSSGLSLLTDVARDGAWSFLETYSSARCMAFSMHFSSPPNTLTLLSSVKINISMPWE